MKRETTRARQAFDEALDIAGENNCGCMKRWLDEERVAIVSLHTLTPCKKHERLYMLLAALESDERCMDLIEKRRSHQ